MSIHGAIHLDSSSTNPTELDPNAHTGDWTRTIGLYTVVAVVAAVVLKSLCCATKGRSVNDTDAPELEEFDNEAGGTAKRVDSIRVKGGRYVSAASRQLDAADDDEDGHKWCSRSREPRAKISRSVAQPKPKPKPKGKPTPKPRPSSRDRGMKPARHPL